MNQIEGINERLIGLLEELGNLVLKVGEGEFKILTDPSKVKKYSWNKTCDCEFSFEYNNTYDATISEQQGKRFVAWASDESKEVELL